jgi:hypothetical protein
MLLDRVVLGLVRDVSNSAVAIVDWRAGGWFQRLNAEQFSSVSNRCSIAQHVPCIIIPPSSGRQDHLYSCRVVYIIKRGSPS